MKHTYDRANLRIHYCKEPQYPNAASPCYFADKLLDIVTAVVSGMGFITAMVCLVFLN